MSAATRTLSSNPYMEGSNDLVDQFGTIADLDPRVVRATQRIVAGHLVDAAVVGEVLDILGIRERVS